MKRLFARLGVDYQQWRALMRAHLLVDYAAILGVYGDEETRRAIRALAGMLLGFGFMGFAPAIVIYVTPDPLLGATAMTAYLAALVAFMALHQSTNLVMPTDYDIIGFRPVSSRTYFAVRLTAVLWRTIEIALATSYLSCVAFLVREGGSWSMALAALLAALVSTTTLTFLLVSGYGWLIRRVAPARVPLLAGYLTTAASMVFGLGMVLSIGAAVDHLIGEAPLWSLLLKPLPRNLVVLALPPTWFAGYVELAAAGVNAFVLKAVALSAVLFLASVLSLRGRLSAGYAARIAELSTQSGSVGRARPRAWRRWRYEARAVVLVAEGQLRHDSAFHSHLASTVVMTFIIFAAPLLQSGFRLPDPFAPGPDGFAFSDFALVYLLSMLPLTCWDGLVTSNAADASWLFFTTPADRVKLVTALRDVTALFIMVPCLVLITVVLFFLYRHPGHALCHGLVLGAIGYNALQATVLISPALPFSRRSDRARNFLPSLARLPVMLAAMFALMAFERLLYPSFTRVAIGLGVMALIAMVLNAWTRVRVSARARTFAYIG